MERSELIIVELLVAVDEFDLTVRKDLIALFIYSCVVSEERVNRMAMGTCRSFRRRQ